MMPENDRLRLVIPSFNRACQLEYLLRSLHDCCGNAVAKFSICAFYRCTDSNFENGYSIVKQQYPHVEFVPQQLNQSFKAQFLGLTDDSEFFGMIVDDMGVLEGFSTTDRPFQILKTREDLFSLSLRLDVAKTFSQPINECAKSPAFDQDLIWRWKPRLSRKRRLGRIIEKVVNKGAFYDWAVPCPLDGTVYTTSMFRKFFETIDDFTNIPFMERSLNFGVERFRSAPPNMIRYARAKAISLAMNSVDEYHDYPSLGLDPKQFNERFLAGHRLDYTPFQKIVFHACHVVTEPFWVPN